MLAEEGFPPHPIDAYRLFVGDGARVLIQRILPAGDAADEEVVSRCLEHYLAIYARRWDEQTRPYPGIPGLLDGLQTRGVRLAVLSNKPHDATRRCIDRFCGEWTWDAVHGHRPDVPRKPDPAGLNLLLDELEVAPEAAVFIGDTATDMLTATRSGVFAVGVLWGFRDRTELEASGASLIAESPKALLDLFG